MANKIEIAADPAPVHTGDSNSFEAGVKMQLKALGSSGTEIFSGYFSEEYLQALRGRKGAKIWDEIRRSESQVSMLMNAVMNPIKAATWEFEAAEVDGGDDHKELIEYCAKDMIDWETHIHEALTFLIFGFSLFEIVNNVIFDHPKFGTFNGLKGLAFRNQKTIERWIVDRTTGDLQSVNQWVQGDLALDRSNSIDMDAAFLLCFSLNKEGDNYEGISALRPMYGAWFRKNLYLKIAAIGVEKNAIGTPLGTVPAGKIDNAQMEKFKEVLSNFTAHESAYLIKPQGWEIEILQNNFDASKLKELILLENTEMINSMVANFLALGMNGGGGAFALGSDLSDFFLAGIQTYANIIAGVWNRKLIPNLVKLNFGEQQAYPKLKATGINDKAGKELAEILRTLSDSQAIKPDMKLEEFLRKQYKLPKADPETAREVKAVGAQAGGPAPAALPAPSLNPQLSEKRIQLAESWKVQWKNDKADVKEVMQAGLKGVLENYKKQVTRLYKQATPAGRGAIALKLQPQTTDYQKALRESLAEIANTALLGARKETPKAKTVKLSERIQLAAPRGGFFDALPPAIKRLVKTQADLIALTQAADLEKIVAFQFTTSQLSTEDIDQIVLDIEAAAESMIEGSTASGASIDAAAGTAVSSISSQARLEWFFEPEVLDTIESFTFTNEDPVSEICQELDGTTWAVNDPDLDRYSPPMHHNCKSRLVPNEKGAEGNPDIDRGGTAVSQKALDSITLCEEPHYHLNLSGPPEGPHGRILLDDDWVTINGEHVHVNNGKLDLPAGGSGKGSAGKKVEPAPAAAAPKVNEHDKEAAFTILVKSVKDSDYDKFNKDFEKAMAKAKHEQVGAHNANQYFRNHKEGMDTNTQKSFTKNTARGKDLKDPSIAVRIDGKNYVLDGQHRLNGALASGQSANALVIDGSFLSKYGIGASNFAGRTVSGVHKTEKLV